MKVASKTDWQRKRLDELGYVGRGKSKHRPRNDSSLYGGEYPFIQTGEIKAADLYISRYTQTYNEKGLAQSKLWEPGTLCITIAANIAETAILKIRACFPDSIVGFIADPEKSDTHFVKYYLDTLKLQMQSISRGTTQDNLPVEKLLSFKLSVPPVPTQRKVATIISAYDDLIENNVRRIQILEEMAQRIYREWFVDFRFPGHEKAKFIDSEMGKIPERWRVGELGDVCDVIPGYAFKSKDWVVEGIPVIKIKNINSDNSINIEDVDCVPQSLCSERLKKFILEQGDFLIAMTGATAGKVGRLRMSAKSLLNQRVAKIKPQRLFDNYIWVLISLAACQNLFYRLADGAAQPNMSGAQIEKFEMLIPEEKILNSFNDIVGPMLKLTDNLYNKNLILRKSRDILLPKLISGEIDVSQMDIAIKEQANGS